MRILMQITDFSRHFERAVRLIEEAARDSARQRIRASAGMRTRGFQTNEVKDVFIKPRSAGRDSRRAQR